MGSRITPPSPVFATAVGLQGRRMIVRLDLEDDIVLVVEPDDSRVVFEYAHARIRLAGFATDLICGGEDRLLEHVREPPLAALILVMDPAGQRFVAAVLAPGLGDGLQFHVGRIAGEGPEVGLKGLHLHKGQVKLPFAAESLQTGGVHLANRHSHKLELVGRAYLQMREPKRSEDHLLDGIIGKDLRRRGVRFDRRRDRQSSTS